MAYRNALEDAYKAAKGIDSDTGMQIESLLDPWSKRQPLWLTDGQVAEMRGLLTAAGATKCSGLFEAALRGTRVLA